VAEVRRDLAARDRIRGEFTLLLEAPAHAAGVSSPDPGTSESVAAKIARLQSESGIDEKEALKRLARELGQSKSEIYRELQRTRARRSKLGTKGQTAFPGMKATRALSIRPGASCPSHKAGANCADDRCFFRIRDR
jgi:hypothetical protein